MPIIKTAELTGPALDWAVAKAEGLLESKPGEKRARVVLDQDWWTTGSKPIVRLNPAPNLDHDPEYAPSDRWDQGGPIIERERITLRGDTRHGNFAAFMDGGRVTHRMSAPAPLVAAMRCFVASKLGLTVEIPEELLT